MLLCVFGLPAVGQPVRLEDPDAQLRRKVLAALEVESYDVVNGAGVGIDFHVVVLVRLIQGIEFGQDGEGRFHLAGGLKDTEEESNLGACFVEHLQSHRLRDRAEPSAPRPVQPGPKS